MKIVAIIQARTTSTRLPNKVLMNISGKSMLWHVVNRVKQAKKVNEIVLAIPDTKKNDILEKFAIENKINYFRGSEENVLFRYYYAAKKFKAHIIVRITSDCPFIDPKIIDKLVKKHLNSDCDYTSTGQKRTFPRGVAAAEVFNFQALQESYLFAQKDFEKEHVTAYIYRHPEKFKLQNIEANKELNYPEYRLCVDAKEDLDLAKIIFSNLGKKDPLFYTEDIVSFLQKNPNLLSINSHIKQKELKK